MTDDERFLDLWNDYLEGELDEEGIAALRILIESDEGRLRLAADSYQTHRLLGLLSEGRRTGSEAFIRRTLDRLPADGEAFTRGVMSRLEQVAGAGPVPAPRRRPLSRPLAIGLATAALAASLVVLLFRPRERGRRGAPERPTAVQLASSAGARFLGEFSPRLRSPLVPRRDYVLTGGLVEIAFPGGASAIIEGPAVFRIAADDCLALDVGRCSVHAPDGAEGFRVETPATDVVDRGTRFAVNVAETSETEVQVIEGIADVYGRAEAPAVPEGAKTSGKRPAESTWVERLTEHEARRFSGSDSGGVAGARYTPSVYRRDLPDRIVSYEATTDPAGDAVNLTSITVQRGGVPIRYPVDRLIPIDLISFRSADEVDVHGHLAGGPSLPAAPGDLLSDAALNTGVINPGGSVRPLEADPVLVDIDDPARSGTPGLGVRFRGPVINRPGPDVVLFELQTGLNPPDGDPFHVSPLRFRNGLRSHTVRAFDLTLTSPEALKLAGLHLYRFSTPITSLAMLSASPARRAPRRGNFRGIAVGVDLSDLGYRDGERVDGLFFQDALDDANRIDPTFIAGIPGS